MIALSDHQLASVMGVAGTVPIGRRDIFLQRAGAMLKMRGRFTDGDVAEVARLAMAGLILHQQLGGVNRARFNRSR